MENFIMTAYQGDEGRNKESRGLVGLVGGSHGIMEGFPMHVYFEEWLLYSPLFHMNGLIIYLITI